ncbi:MAG: spore germination protein [Firmicutes bacterium]|nr:spore germination protein [Bacillota bacterium]
MKFSLTKNQFFVFLFIVQTGSISIAFQSPIIKAAQQDAWIVFIVALVIQFFILVLFEKYYKHFVMNRLLRWIYSIYIMLILVLFVANIQKSLAVWVFQNTPPYVIVAIIVATSLYANMSRPESVVNLGVLLVPLFPLIFFFLFLATPDLIWTNLFPMGNISGKEWVNGLKEANLAFVGTEMYLIYRGYLLNTEKIFMKTIGKYILFIGSCYLITILFTIMFFSLAEIAIVPEPIVYILKSQEVQFIERIDLFFIIIWMMWSVITVIYLVFTVVLIFNMKKTKKGIRSVIGIHLLLFIIPLIIIWKDFFKVGNEILMYGYFVFALIIPFLVILVNTWRSKNDQKT